MKESENLVIKHTTDMHGRGEYLSAVADIQKCDLLLDSGDAILGSNIVYKKNEPIFEIMNRCKYTAMAMGNREFSYYAAILKKRLESVSFPILALNLKDKKKRFPELLKKYIVIKKNGINILISALTPIQYGENSIWAKLTGFIFTPYTESIKTLLASEEAKSSDFIIILSHCGIDDDLKLAEDCPGIGLILGGHTHIRFNSPVIKNGVHICHSGCFGKSISEYTFNIKNGKPYSFKSKHIEKTEK